MADLVTLAAVKQYLAITTGNQDALIAALITRESRMIEQYTSRRFPAVTNTARRLNGTGTGMLMLPDSPIISIALLQINGVSISPSADGIQPGYTFDDSCVYLTGGEKFPMGRQNVTCSWTAGYQEADTETIPANPGPYTITPGLSGAAANDLGVVFAATGAALAPVAANVAAGQYIFSQGVYTFAAADTGKAVTMSYQYVPGPVAQSCIEMVGIDLKSRDNLGINSKTLAGETISYSSRGMTASCIEQLNPYRRVAPA